MRTETASHPQPTYVMPKVIALFRKHSISDESLKEIGKKIRVIVAQAVSTPFHPITEEDIDWIPNELHESSIAAEISFEIETIGYVPRKEKLAQGSVQKELKLAFINILLPYLPSIKPKDPLIWIKFQDVHGDHF